MLRILINLLFLVFIIGLIGRVVRAFGRFFQRPSEGRVTDSPGPDAKSTSDLSPYEISDGDYEDIEDRG